MDAKKIAIGGLKSAFDLFRKDLEAVPEEAITRKFGEKARTVADIVYEVNLVNDHIGMVIRGEEPFQWPDVQWITAPEDFQTKDVVIAAFETSAKKMIETVEAFTPEQFEEPLMTDQGEKTRFERCRFMTLHMWYHCGQINYIQTMIGDDVWHWM